MHDVNPAPGRVLVVEDNPDVLAAVVDALTERGYSVDSATDGLKALALLRIVPQPDVILLDLMMPRVDGAHFLAELRQIPAFQSVPVILMTANQLSSHQFRDLNASALLAKPFSVKDLLATVDLHRGARLN